MAQRSAIVIGAGIVGLAAARALAIKGYGVKVIERNAKAVGASIRNFGMIWPIGQSSGQLYERAMLSKSIWKEIANEAGIWHEESGSLHLAYSKQERDVLEELVGIYKDRNYELLDANRTAQKSEAIETAGLMGSLYSADEMII